MTKPENILSFVSSQYGPVLLVKKSVGRYSAVINGESVNYYKGQLVLKWCPVVVSVDGQIEQFIFCKGQIVWLSDKYFKPIPMDLHM